MSSQQEPTRREKRFLVREAVTAALQERTHTRVVSHDDYSDIIDDLVDDVQRNNRCEVPVDDIDVTLALRALHDQEVVRVAHYDAEGRYVHSVILKRH